MLKYLKYLGYTLISIISGIFLISTISYLGIINYTIKKVLIMVVVGFSVFIPAYLLGKSSKTKGYIEGAKLGLLLVVVFIIFNAFFKVYKIYQIIYYLIIVCASILGGMIGISSSENNK